MKLYLMRHGKANPENIDPGKSLSDVGEKDVTRLAESIGYLDIRVEQIWHSEKKRAKQTAEIISAAVKPQKGLVEKSGLLPNDQVTRVAKEIIAINADLMLVGHLPFMSKLASYLLSGDEDTCAIDFSAGAVACFEYDKGRWTLCWLVYPGLFKQKDKHGFYSYH
ncbi:MAG: phosphohistidine phosphatase SixA [candidate division Zixibacteria bacterium 4484_95]|nr:MAG: phosphohistidine phosphatase SixA [candidate division Zixibacteria bacterium 4484_95]RKX17416.1 MAG: phosphohistidine phosphatase SixA [candidate division Zixibacteria bacterium]